MSELNEELLNDVDDYPDLGEADEDALLQDDEDGDVLDIVPEELGESSDDTRANVAELDEDTEAGSRKDKFAVERERITAPEVSSEFIKLVKLESSNQETPRNNNFQRPNNRYQRGRGGNSNGRGRYPNNSRGRFPYGNQSGRNKTVLINPRFQGVVHVNNNARLAWDTPQQQQQQYPPNPWAAGAPPGSFPPPQNTPMQPMQGGPPMQHYQEPRMQQMHQMQNMGPPLQYTPPQHQPYMPQPLPPGVPPNQNPAPTTYWNGQNQYTSAEQIPNQQINPFMQNNYQSPPPMMMNTNQSPPNQGFTQNYNMYNQPGNPPHMQQGNFNQGPNFTPNRRGFSNNNSNNMQYNQGNTPRFNRREMPMQKRKVTTPGYTPNKKLIQERLGSTPQVQARSKTFAMKHEDRIPVMKPIPVITTVKLEEDDDTKDLRLKIEEQKRKREEILQWKEKRRQMKLGSQVLANDQNVNIQIKSENSEIAVKVEPKLVFAAPHVKMRKQSNNIVITNGYSRKSTKYQKTVARVVTAVPKAPPAVPAPAPEPELKLDKEHLSNFLADRKILPVDESLMSTRKVVIKNISTSTGDKKIFQISKSMGEVQKLHRDKNERQATITFKSVASAHAFFKKYQRHMLDLSVIEVSLCPMTESDE